MPTTALRQHFWFAKRGEVCNKYNIYLPWKVFWLGTFLPLSVYRTRVWSLCVLALSVTNHLSPVVEMWLSLMKILRLLLLLLMMLLLYAADTVCSHLERVGQLTAAGQKFDSSFLAALWQLTVSLATLKQLDVSWMREFRCSMLSWYMYHFEHDL